MNAADIHHAGAGRKSDTAIRDALGGAVDALAAAGVETPRLDAEILLCEATGWDRASLAAGPEDGVPPAAARRFGEMVRRRLRREPVAYIVGRKGFRHLELAVDRRVLIPRPETELLVELALELRPGRLLDVGTGSGAIALAVAQELPDCEVTASDTSAAALEVARANADRLGLAERVRFGEETLPDGADRFDLVVANLPYVSEAEWGRLQPEVTEWEPREALLAGPAGLDAIRAFLAECVRGLSAYARLNANAVVEGSRPVVALEVGAGQAAEVAELVRAAGWGSVEARRDLAGIERVVVGTTSAP
ncbi:MAG TPA: peptide chain release factor N(5)-glutamine methyltransferase [Solirubrobacterales bacterium]|nr:peptide chain release factor N(5)-glutamine methyltransferase [Solirubrobacterales bacterium]